VKFDAIAEAKVEPVPAAPARVATYPTWLPKPTPKNLITLLITLILVVGEWTYGVVGGYEKLAMTLGTCVALEIALSYWLVGRKPQIQSAYITGISLTILLRPAAGLIWPFLVGAALSIGCKYVLRYKNRHLWNPSNFGLSVLLLLAPSRVALLSHEFGNDIYGNAVIWFVGLLVASKAKVLHISLTYALSFTALAALRSAITGAPFLAEVAPLTGPMYQLLCFFMLTDPRTVVSTRRGRIATVLIIAVVETIFRLANDYNVPGAAIFAPAPPILALFIIGPIAFAWDLHRTAKAS
jgi:Na+-translocating ferredoxin:NAD+ oxidoreductase RnfD subunit